MRKKQKFQENFPGQIRLFVTLPIYLFNNLFCFKYSVGSEFFPNFEVIFQNQIKLPKLSYII